MKYLLVLISLMVHNPTFAQDDSIIAYHYKAKDINGILLLNCNIGYNYIGPHFFVDEIFSYEIIDNKLIRTLDEEYSLYRQVDTLIIKRNTIHAPNGIAFKKVRPKKRDKLIRKYIIPEINIGVYKIFLNRTGACIGKEL